MNLEGLSIITIVRNDPEGLRHTMDSVLSQDYLGIEYIIVDGASTDGTTEVIRTYAHRISDWVSEPDGGVYDAMNKGFQMSTREWVLFLNAGDWFLDASVVTDALASTGSTIDAIYGDAIYILEDGAMHLMAASSPELLSRGPFCSHQSLFMRRGFIQKVGGFNLDEWPVADYGLIARVHSIGCRWKHVSRPFVVYSMGGISDIYARLGHIKAWAISRKHLRCSMADNIGWVYMIFRDLIRDILRGFGMRHVVLEYRKFKAKRRSQNV